MIYKWNYEQLTIQEEKLLDKLTQKLEISPVLCQLLIRRGIKTEEQAKKFFYPSLDDLHDPFLLPDMDKAVKRIEKALGNKERIMLYGDYDVDGTTAVALVYKYFRQFTSNIDYYIPDRYAEGYGISEQGIDYAYQTGVTLIITLDCGIKAIDKVAYAKTKGIDFIIGDHHMPDDELPDAIAIIDTKRLDSTYPYEHLSGCGIGFKLAQALAQSSQLDPAPLRELLDLVAVSIASDIVPITGENRILAYYGLKQINSNPSLGLKGIIDICGLAYKRITISDIIFKIGPRINASGRMENGKEAVDLLLSSTIEEAREKSENIDRYNDNRRELDKKITEEANTYINENIDLSKRNSIVVYQEDWHQGVIGIVASRLTEKYLRPAIVLSKSQGIITGSARSIVNFDVYKAIESCKDLLESFGGHTYAAGLSLKEENFLEFRRRFEQQSTEKIEPEMMSSQIDISAELPFREITKEFADNLLLFAPFGPENINPVFMTQRARDYGTSRLVGKDNIHLKLEMIDDTSSLPRNGIAFRQRNKFEDVKSGNLFSICYTLEENQHRGKTSIQLYVKDIDTRN